MLKKKEFVVSDETVSSEPKEILREAEGKPSENQAKA
jgi:hypothetical protein